MRRFWVVAGLLAGCVESESVTCADGSLCARGEECVELSPTDDMIREFVCASPEELAPCKTKSDGDPCGEETANQFCRDRLCVAGACGDGVVSGDEQCDTAIDPTCATTCLSFLVCGNTIRDPGEDCDDGNQLGGDGCSSICRLESPQWSTLSLAIPPARRYHAVAYDTRRGTTIVVGGEPAADAPPLGSTWVRAPGGLWTEYRPPIAPAPVTYAGMVFDSRRDRAVLFGGNTESLGSTNDLWEWDGREWFLAATTGPSPRQRFAMAYDPIRGVTVVVGGDRGSNRMVGQPKYVGDAWSWDGTTWTELPTPTPGAGICCGAMAFDPVRGKLVLVGGELEKQVGPDFVLEANPNTFEFDGTSWTAMPVSVPDDRYDVRATYSPAPAGVLALTGGKNADEPQSSGRVYLFDGSSWVEQPNAVTPPRTGSALVTTDDGVTLVGGISTTGRDELVLVRVGRAWESPPLLQSLAGLVFSNRYATDPVTGLTVGYKADRSILYELGRERLNLAPINDIGLDESFDAPIAFDRDGALVLLRYGTSGPGTMYQGTRGMSSTGPAWTFTPLAVPTPSARRGSIMIYDAARRRTILYGGVGEGTFYDETWSWDGFTWTQLALSNAPPMRVDMAAAYDARRSEVVIYGGTAPGQSIVNEAWALDATGWHRRDSMDPLAPRPLGRTFASLAYDVDRERIVMHGGRVPNTTVSDTWELGDNGWERLRAQSPPIGPTQALFTAPDGHGVWHLGDTISRLSWGSDEPVDVCRARDSDGDGASGCDDRDCWRVCSPLCRPDGDPCEGTPRCGDGMTSGVETCQTCPVDVAECVVCGDYICDGDESVGLCPGDCSP